MYPVSGSLPHMAEDCRPVFYVLVPVYLVGNFPIPQVEPSDANAGSSTMCQGGGKADGPMDCFCGSPSCLLADTANSGSGHVCIYVKVPTHLVGFVVGQKGARIKHIQDITNTFIVTPFYGQEPYFSVFGRGEDVERAKKEIESCITAKTGVCYNSDSKSDTLSPLVESGIVSFCSSIICKKQRFSPRWSVSPPAPPPNLLTCPAYGVEAMSNTYGNQWIEPATRSPLSSAMFGGGNSLKDTFS